MVGRPPSCFLLVFPLAPRNLEEQPETLPLPPPPRPPHHLLPCLL